MTAMMAEEDVAMTVAEAKKADAEGAAEVVEFEVTMAYAGAPNLIKGRLIISSISCPNNPRSMYPGTV